MDLDLRAATLSDLPAIADLRVRSWQQAYRGLVPQHVLDGLRPESEAERRQQRFASPGTGPWHGLRDHVAVANGVVVGWAAIGPYQGEDQPRSGCGEIAAIYLDPDHWSRGIGRALMGHVLAELVAVGLTPVLLWVLEENDRARRFYERCGFWPDGARQLYAVGGAELPEIRYRYDP